MMIVAETENAARYRFGRISRNYQEVLAGVFIELALFRN